MRQVHQDYYVYFAIFDKRCMPLHAIPLRYAVLGILMFNASLVKIILSAKLAQLYNLYFQLLCFTF